MRLTQEVIEKIQLAMTHTKMNGETNWKDGDEIDVCLGGTFAGDKFISIITINYLHFTPILIFKNIFNISSCLR